MVLIDECHATGFVGKTGRGTPELLDVMQRVDLINSTLGKALGTFIGINSTRIIVELSEDRRGKWGLHNGHQGSH